MKTVFTVLKVVIVGWLVQLPSGEDMETQALGNGIIASGPWKLPPYVMSDRLESLTVALLVASSTKTRLIQSKYNDNIRGASFSDNGLAGDTWTKPKVLLTTEVKNQRSKFHNIRVGTGFKLG